MEFHERLKYIRENKSFKQKDIAEKLGIKNNTLSSYESGARQPDYQTLIKIADLYDCSVEYLLTGKENNTPKGNLFFYDAEGLTEEEIDDIERHIAYVKWKAEQDRGK